MNEWGFLFKSFTNYVNQSYLIQLSDKIGMEDTVRSPVAEGSLEDGRVTGLRLTGSAALFH